MCGIVGYWAKEANLNRNSYRLLLEGALKRGSDGIGIVIYDIDQDRFIWNERYLTSDISIENIVHNILLLMIPGRLLFISCRATPETENITTLDMIQPIISDKDGLVLIHNGGVTDSVRREVSEYEFETKIDSEMILASYILNGNDMKACMEKLSGSFAFLMLDRNKKKLYSATSFNPLAHMYIRGYGYFFHSDNQVLEEVLFSLTGNSRDGVNVWESWYHHYLDGYTIIETDLESGSQFKQEYKPRFLFPESRKRAKKNTEVLVSASGGIDSGLTACVFRKLDYDVRMIFFQYGQKSEEAELWAVRKQAEGLHCRLKIVDLRELYTRHMKVGMLLDPYIPIDSGGENLKSTICWVPGRNTIFSSILLGIGESFILKGICSNVIISAGWAQLSEETGGYPDNSFQFANTINLLAKYGYITGSNIGFVPLFQRLTKTEEWVLGDALGFPFEVTVSCDRALMIDCVPHLCQKCGSTKLSMLASDRAGVPDNRRFLGKRRKTSDKMKVPSIENIISRLILCDSDKSKLLRLTEDSK
jgi:7-cyano-7-deazaguanine synthase